MLSTQTRTALRAALMIAGSAALAVMVAANSVPVDYKPSGASLHLSEAMVARLDGASNSLHPQSAEEARR